MQATREDMPESSRQAVAWFRDIYAQTLENGEITKSKFSETMKYDKDFVHHLFEMLDGSSNGSLCIQEFSGGLFRISRSCDEQQPQIKCLISQFLEKAAVATSGVSPLREKDFGELCAQRKFSNGFYRLFDVNEDGKVDVREFLVCMDRLASTSTDERWCDWAEKWFLKQASEDGRISRQKFLSGFNFSESMFGNRLFDVVDTDSNGCADVTEMLGVIHVLTHGTPKQRLLLLFSVYDTDGDGKLTRREIMSALKWCFVENSMKIKGKLTEKLTELLFSEMDQDKSGDVTLAEFENFLTQYPQVTDNITLSIPQLMMPYSKGKRTSCPDWQGRTLDFISNNKSLIGYWMVYFTVNIVLFVTAASNYWSDYNVFVVFARGPGQCLNFNSAYIVILVYRNILTFLRSTWVRNYLPLDHSIAAHKFTGVIIVVYSLIHTVMHVINFGLLSRRTDVTWAQYLFTLQPGLGWVGGSACITGWILIVVLAVIGVTASPWCRHHGYFQLFYWAHWLFIAWWAVLVIHAPRFWKWLVGPATIFVLEKIWSEIRKFRMSGTLIHSIKTVNSKVSQVLIERPEHFKFKAGDYIFVQIEEIAKFEWHPFTISSAPEQRDLLSLHVSAVGDWTKRLRALGEIKENLHIKYKIANRESERAPVAIESRPYFIGSPVRLKSLQRIRVKESGLKCSIETVPSTLQSQTDKTNVVNSILGQEMPPQNNLSQGKDLSPNNDFSTQENDSILPEQSVLTQEAYVSPRMRNDLPLLQLHKSQSTLTDLESANKIKIRIDGPYGSPSTGVYTVDHAILIGAGIGVTPFSSVLQSIMYRRLRQRETCQKCRGLWFLPGYESTTEVSKTVDFIWVTRKFESLEWLVDVLGKLEEEQSFLPEEERFLTLRLHVTSALAQSEIRSVLLQIALELCYQKEAREALYGLRTRIQPGRPNWKEIFDAILLQRTGKTCVFYCGPPKLEKVLKALCKEYKLEFRVEHF